jgi:hypothetical protein
MSEQPSISRIRFEAFWRDLLTECSLSPEEIEASCRHFRAMPLRELSEFCFEMARLLNLATAEQKVESLARIEAKALRSLKRR